MSIYSDTISDKSDFPETDVEEPKMVKHIKYT